MKLVLLLLGAIALIILGARGTYKAVWNQFFPNEPIVTTPVSTAAMVNQVPGSNVPPGAAQQQNQSPSGYSTNPQEVGQNAAKATQNWINGLINGGSTGATHASSVSTGSGPYGVEVIGQSGGQYRYTDPNNASKTGGSPYTGQSYGPVPYPKNTGKPSWWPSWVLWPGDLITFQGG